jgi:hypothetical protein
MSIVVNGVIVEGGLFDSIVRKLMSIEQEMSTLVAHSLLSRINTNIINLVEKQSIREEYAASRKKLRDDFRAKRASRK